MAEWPVLADVQRWMGRPADNVPTAVHLAALVDVATESILARIDTDKLPADESCPATIRQAIIMHAARLMMRADSPTGSPAYGDGTPTPVQVSDADVDALLLHWRPDPDPT